MQTERPVGVVILAFLNLLGGSIGLCFNGIRILFGGLSGLGGAVTGQTQLAETGASIFSLGFVGLGLSVFGLLVFVGLFSLQSWAWSLTILLQGLNLLLSVANIFQGEQILGSLIQIIISGLILYYLFRPNVKIAFGQ
ncbi:MAG: hypothetical protein AAGG02_17845 [Cyanobacteria bacterium P01_H01_bin.15]